MSDQDNLTIDIQIGTRATMNTGTPRLGPWTYHHVLPVRLYFMAAWTLLRVAKHRDCWSSTRVICREALHSMCQNRANEQHISLFLDKIQDNPSHLDLTNHAKLCASPPAGGFGGPNPGQRMNDPHDQPEGLKPVSASGTWYALIGQVGRQLKTNYGLRVMPTPNALVTQTQPVMNWCEMCETLAGSLKGIGDIGPQHFNGTDWILASGRPWTLEKAARYPNGTNVDLRLRGKMEPVTFYDSNGAVALPQGTLKLRRADDYIQSGP